MKKTFFSFIAISCMFIVSFFALFQGQEKRFLEGSEDRLCLNERLDKDILKKSLIKHRYVKTETDADLISTWLIDSIFKERKMTLPNLGSLNSWKFQIPAYIVEEYGGSGLKERLELSYKQLGCDSISINEYNKYQNKRPSADTTCVISVVVKDSETKDAVAGITVRLKQYKENVDDKSDESNDHGFIVECSKTNEDGIAFFNVCRDSFYSVLPVNNGYEYGVPKGTTNNKPIGQEDDEFTFFQKQHRIRMFDKATYARIKGDGTITVRSTGDYVSELVKIASIFLLAWWLTFFYIKWIDRRIVATNILRYRASDGGILSILMLLNAICIFTMLAITNPLTDMGYASEMIWGTLFGCFGLCLLSSLDYVRYYSNQYRIKFDIVSGFLREHISNRVPQGLGFLIIALLLVLILYAFGTGPQGSSAKVNISFFGMFIFQPSEISKFLFVIAIALFFTANAARIQAFAAGRLIGSQFKTLVWIVLAVLLLLALYVALISDMGPALVLAITFIIMYSIVRKDLPQMLLGVASYILILYFSTKLSNIDRLDNFAGNELSNALYLSLIWFVVWFAGGYLWKKRIYESAGFMNLLILLFMRGGDLLKLIPLTANQGQRLANRIAASGDGIWDNTVRGGDQVAQGIWALSSGGFKGQGIENAYANLIPAFHTDMIFESIGEVMGFVSLFFVLVFYAILIWRCLLRARESGHPFLFYIISGIGIVTAVQLFVIVMGSLGIIPLTGVSLPFMSYGKVSLIINLSAFGIILGMSRNNPTHNQKISIIGYNTVIKSGLAVFALLFAVVIVYAYRYQVSDRNYYLTKSAYITNLDGEHFPEHNPRINILLRKIESGNIYDRNGLLLATSSTESLQNEKKPLVDAGIGNDLIDSLSHAVMRRYYPFGEHLFFMLGDMNTRNLSQSVFETNTYGFLAEERLIDSLRGFLIPKELTTIEKVSKPSPFLPEKYKKEERNILSYENNDTILMMLKDGINGDYVRQWNENRHTRDITMTLDAKLQMDLQSAMESHSEILNDPYSRVSCVVLDAINGDLLCSANYPLPNQELITEVLGNGKDWYQINTQYGRYTERDLGLTYQTRPGSTAKIMSAIAGLKGLGEDVKIPELAYDIRVEDRIFRNAGSTPETSHEPYRKVSMNNAIVYSSNCYFVHLINSNDLYRQLDIVYQAAGVRINYANNTYNNYVFYTGESGEDNKLGFSSMMRKMGNEGISRYNDYRTWDNKKRNGVEGNRGMSQIRVKFLYGMGDRNYGELEASPLNMARVASIPANSGKLARTRYLVNEPIKCDTIISKERSDLLRTYMSAEASNSINAEFAKIGGGKTGTPTRSFNKKMKDDGWYICYIKKPSESNKGNQKEVKEEYLAVALRVEQCDKKAGSPGGSAMARKYMKEVVLPTLINVGYVKY